MRVGFGEYVFDEGSRQLFRDGGERHLAPKAFDLLALLIRQRPNVVTKEHIRQRLWPATAVTDSTVATVVADLRHALNEDPQRPRYLRTVHRVGYAFCGDVELAELPPHESRMCCRLVLQDRELSLSEGEHVLGRAEDADVWIPSTAASRHHARIVVRNGDASLEDLGSRNGTFLGDERVEGPAPLRDGDQVRIGGVAMTFRTLHPDESTCAEEH